MPAGNRISSKNEFLERVQKHVDNGLYANTPIVEVAQHSGSRSAHSKFESEDGQIVVAFDHWVQANGIEIAE